MHEQGIANDILNKAKDYGNVKSITVECGDLGHLPAAEMRSVLEKMTNWEIFIVKKEAKVKCENCGFEGAPKILQQLHDHNIYECPECEEMFPKVLDGDQIILKDVVVG